MLYLSPVSVSYVFFFISRYCDHLDLHVLTHAFPTRRSFYLQRVKNVIYHLSNYLPSFAILDRGRREDEKSCIWVENGAFYGMGYIDRYADVERVEEVRSEEHTSELQSLMRISYAAF